MGATDTKRRLSIESKDGGGSASGKRKYRKHKTGPGKACVYCRRRFVFLCMDIEIVLIVVIWYAKVVDLANDG